MVIKRDHVYAQKICLICFVCLLVVFWLAHFYLGQLDEYDMFMYGLYQSFYMMSVFCMAAYPLHALISISPKRNELLNSPMITAFIPISRAQLLWQNLKPWLIIYPIYIVLATMLYQIYFEHAAKWAFSMTFVLVFGSMGMLFLSFMTMSGIIKILSEKDKIWLLLGKSVVKMTGVFLIGLGISFGLRLDVINDLTWLFIVASLLLGYSLWEFKGAVRYIEYIYQ